MIESFIEITEEVLGFPKLMEYTNEQGQKTIILATDGDDCNLEGFIVYTESNEDDIGFFSKTWTPQYRDYNGEITIKNK